MINSLLTPFCLAQGLSRRFLSNIQPHKQQKKTQKKGATRLQQHHSTRGTKFKKVKEIATYLLLAYELCDVKQDSRQSVGAVPRMPHIMQAAGPVRTIPKAQFTGLAL